MTIFLNYRPVLRNPTGIGVYANAVLSALQDLPHVLIPGGEEGTAKQRLKRLAWTQFKLQQIAERNQASLVFTPAPEGYLGPQRIPQVVMVHDLRPISHPDCSLQSIYFRSWVPPLLQKCRHILTNSQFTAEEIQRCASVKDHGISVIPLGYDSNVFCPSSEGSGGFTEGLHRPYLLHVGQAYPHKNLQRLIRAFVQITKLHPDVILILAGKAHPTETPRLKRLVKELMIQDQVVFCDYVPYHQLPDLYRGAMALVYPSLWEGFGLPVLEAMACGTPVITSKGSGTQEVAGDAALLVDPVDIEMLVDTMDQVLRQPSLRRQLSMNGLARAGHFSWQTCATETAKTLAALAKC